MSSVWRNGKDRVILDDPFFKVLSNGGSKKFYKFDYTNSLDSYYYVQDWVRHCSYKTSIKIFKKEEIKGCIEHFKKSGIELSFETELWLAKEGECTLS